MKKIIYIRHGNDERGEYKYDEMLTLEGKENCGKVCKKLVEEHGLPDIIYCSPFYRTRQTRKEMVKYIKKYLYKNGIDKKIKLKTDVRLGRFFAKKERRNPDISEDTMKKGALIHESFEEFHNRIDEQLEHVINKKSLVIWNITHSLVILRVVKKLNIPYNSRVEYLDYYII